MCLIAFALDASARWPLVVAANRDEFLERPTLALTSWKTASSQEIISGRDVRAGGTWLGATPTGRVAFVTNVREAQPAEAPCSRGELVTRWLEGSMDAAGFATALETERNAYAGFNLVIGDIRCKAWLWMTNRTAEASPGWRAQALAPGIYGLSNAALDTPWPKTLALKQALAAALAASGEQDTLMSPLWTALSNRQRVSCDEQLPKTGVAPALEQALSSAFVDIPERAYGTRGSTVLLASRQLDSTSKALRLQIEERTYLREVGASHLPFKRQIWTGQEI
ncbi:MAG: NRDE family protein [Polaromonas sp.]